MFVLGSKIEFAHLARKSTRTRCGTVETTIKQNSPYGHSEKSLERVLKNSKAATRNVYFQNSQLDSQITITRCTQFGMKILIYY